MNQTKLMRADEIANGFNSVEDRMYWRASVAGTRVNPEVHFNSRASMVCVSYRLATDDFTVTFSKANAAFGDFLASTHRSMGQVLAGLKAAGLPFEDPFQSAPLRLEYDPASKVVTVHMPIHPDDVWAGAEPLPFKVPERKKIEEAISGVDGDSTSA